MLNSAGCHAGRLLCPRGVVALELVTPCGPVASHPTLKLTVGAAILTAIISPAVLLTVPLVLLRGVAAVPELRAATIHSASIQPRGLITSRSGQTRALSRQIRPRRSEARFRVRPVRGLVVAHLGEVHVVV